MQDRADPHARERAFAAARRDPPSGVSPDEAVAEVCELAQLDRRHLPRVPAERLGRLPLVWPPASW